MLQTSLFEHSSSDSFLQFAQRYFQRKMRFSNGKIHTENVEKKKRTTNYFLYAYIDYSKNARVPFTTSFIYIFSV